MKKSLTIMLSIVLFTLILTSCSSKTGASNSEIVVSPTPTAPQGTTVNIGDRVQIGKYNDEPIIWRCVDIDENGPLMIADKILTIKPFDVKGKHKYIDGTPQVDSGDYRTGYGSNLWETSNIRSWLNSTATAGNVVWLDGCPPSKDRVKLNSYDKEKGFLVDSNFTKSEQNIIKSVTQKSLLNILDVAKLSVGGTAIHKYDDSYITTAVQNYDTAYYHNVVDKMFLLDVKQVARIHQNHEALGIDYFIGKPTLKAVALSEYKHSELSAEIGWRSLIRSPFTEDNDPIGVRGINIGGTVISYAASDEGMGIRPAFYINLTTLTFSGGNGSAKAPYTL